MENTVLIIKKILNKLHSSNLLVPHMQIRWFSFSSEANYKRSLKFDKITFLESKFNFNGDFPISSIENIFANVNFILVQTFILSVWFILFYLQSSLL